MVVADPSTSTRAPRAVLSHFDHAELEWFFGVAPARFERSTSGSVLEKISSESPYEIMLRGFEYGRPGTEPVHGSQGQVIGHRSALSARPTAEVKIAPKKPDDDETVQREDYERTRFARISRRVQALAALPHGAVYVEVLRAYFGDSGNAWAHLALEGGPFEMVDGKAKKKASNPYAEHASHGRVGALYVLVRSGRLLLELLSALAKKKGQPDLGFTDDLRMRLEVCSSKGPERKALLARARSEALALFAATVIAWNGLEAQHES